MGADVLRLWVSATDYSGELSVSDEILNRTSDAYRRIRNTLRYLLSNLDGFDPETDQVSAKEMIALDYWIVHKTNKIQTEIKAFYDTYQFHKIYNLIHNFCVQELGSDYLDIIKDRQYTCQEKSHSRRSSQTAQYHIAEALIRWISPILSFTAEEAWKHIPGGNDKSIFTEEWYNLDNFLPDIEISDVEWNGILSFKQTISKRLESMRNAKEIGSSLEVEVEIWNAPNYFNKIDNDELRFIFITSYANSLDGEAPQDAEKAFVTGGPSALSGEEHCYIRVKKSEHIKCVRCWHYREDVGNNNQHPELCSRCVSNLPDGKGEERLYA